MARTTNENTLRETELDVIAAVENAAKKINLYMQGYDIEELIAGAAYEERNNINGMWISLHSPEKGISRGRFIGLDAFKFFRHQIEDIVATHLAELASQILINSYEYSWDEAEKTADIIRGFAT